MLWSVYRNRPISKPIRYEITRDQTRCGLHFNLRYNSQLHLVASAPEFPHPAYMVFPREADSEVLQQAIEGLRELAQKEQAQD